MGFSLEADKQYKHPQRQLKFVCIIVGYFPCISRPESSYNMGRVGLSPWARLMEGRKIKLGDKIIKQGLIERWALAV
jgi:hypothetical protein